MFRPLRPYQVVVDALLGFLLCGFCLVASVVSGGWGVALPGTVISAAVVLRRLQPGWALVGAWLGAGVQMFTLSQAPSVADLGIPVVLYATAAYGSDRVRRWGLVSALTGSLIATGYLVWVSAGEDGLWTGPASANTAWTVLFLLATIAAVLTLAWTLGLLARTVERARRASVEREFAERERAIQHERVRIARDMHDVVAHTLGVMIAQADGARYRLDQSGTEVDTALKHIAGLGREALGDVRGLLAELREIERPASISVTEPPLLSTDDRELVERFSRAGLQVRLTEAGERWQAGVATATVQRILVESLTNALRHGMPGAAADVTIDWRSEQVSVSVCNRVRDRAATPHSDTSVSLGGNGLIGMRERAALAGGTLTVALDAGVWTVHLVVPSRAANIEGHDA